MTMQTLHLQALCEPPSHNSAPTVVLCATARLGSSLRQRQAQAMGLQQVAVWEPLHTATVDQWLNTLVQDALLRGSSIDGPLVAHALTPAQQRLVWEQIIEADLQHSSNPFLDIASLARTAQEAQQLHTVWQVPVGGGSVEQRRFATWLHLFHERCQRHQLTTPELQHAAFLQALQSGLHVMPSGLRVVWAGFHRFNPLEQALQHALQQQGVNQWALEPDTPATQVRCQRYPDPQHEALAAALWAQAHIAQHPSHQVGIVVPDLAAQRHRIADTLEHVLSPAAVRPRHAEDPRPFNISLGLPLTEYALVSSALQLLDWVCTQGPIDWATLSLHLRNPLWSSPQELNARAQLEAHLRRHTPPRIQWPAYASTVAHTAEQLRYPVPKLLQHLQHVQSGPTLSGKQLPSSWASYWWPRLEPLGWLHQHTLSSHDFQIKQAFAQVIQHTASLDALLGPISATKYLRELRRMCQERIYQPQTEGHPPIQVLGLLEASGLRFDALWVMGLTNSVWPPAARPNPMLAWDAQRQAQSPNASPPVQWTFAQQVHAQLLRAAPDVVLSWPHAHDATELQPSPLLPHTYEIQGPQNSPHWTYTAITQKPGQYLQPPIDDTQAPPVKAGERVRGGSALLKAQAICPAWAFVQFRLGASKLETPSEGMDPRQRGSIVHAVLEHFWQHVGSSQVLASLSPSALLSTIEASVDHALHKQQTQPNAQAPSPRALQLERNRLVRLTSQWLELERQRPDNFEVIACERPAQVDLEGIHIKLVMDRIDQLDNGDVLIIDYKTGQTIDFKNWSTNRLSEPQLPLYAAIAPPAEGAVAGLLFGKVTLKKPAWAGITRHDETIPGVRGLDNRYARRHFDAARFPDWPALLAHWQTALRQVAQDIQQGQAAVRFDRATDLQYCDVAPVLRLQERQQQWLQRTNASSSEDV